MGTKRSLFKNLPIYMRLADDNSSGILSTGHGVLQHLCSAIQAEYDEIYRLLAFRDVLFNPDLTKMDFMDYISQLVGMGTRGDHYLGIGLNPDWDYQTKRDVIWRFYPYTQIKGTEEGIREAIAIWLRWENSKDPEKLLIYLPHGKETGVNRNIWQWDTTYGSNEISTVSEKHEYASGDFFPGQNYISNTRQLTREESLDQWIDNLVFTLEEVEVPTIDTILSTDDLISIDQDFSIDSVTGTFPIRGLLEGYREAYIRDIDRSHIGPRNVWLHYTFLPNEESEWNKINPNWLTLEKEALDIMAEPVSFSWLTFDSTYTDIYFVKEKEKVVIEEWVENDLVGGFLWGDLDYGIAFTWSQPQLFPTQIIERPPIIIPGEIIDINLLGIDWLWGCWAEWNQNWSFTKTIKVPIPGEETHQPEPIHLEFINIFWDWYDQWQDCQWDLLNSEDYSVVGFDGWWDLSFEIPEPNPDDLFIEQLPELGLQTIRQNPNTIIEQESIIIEDHCNQGWQTSILVNPLDQGTEDTIQWVETTKDIQLCNLEGEWGSVFFQLTQWNSLAKSCTLGVETELLVNRTPVVIPGEDPETKDIILCNIWGIWGEILINPINRETITIPEVSYTEIYPKLSDFYSSDRLKVKVFYEDGQIQSLFNATKFWYNEDLERSVFFDDIEFNRCTLEFIGKPITNKPITKIVFMSQETNPELVYKPEIPLNVDPRMNIGIRIDVNPILIDSN